MSNDRIKVRKFPTTTLIMAGILLGGVLCLSCSHRGTVLVGGACTADEACATNVCIREASSSWAGGYCSGNCGNTPCPQGRCLPFADGRSYCVAMCAADSDCRSDYVCSSAVGACLPDCRRGWSCGDQLICDAATGACTVPMSVAGTVPFGTACSFSVECASGTCIPERNDAGNIWWSGGMCSADCTSTSCPGGAACVPLADGRAYCVPSCASTSDCRQGYVCSSGVGGCLPDCRLGWDCGDNLACDTLTGACSPPAGNAPLGTGCTYSLECASDLCIAEHNSAGAVAWSGGMCVLECANASCPAGAACVRFEDGGAYCVPACASTDDCRTGYVCSAEVVACLPDCRLGWDCGESLTCDATTGACTLPTGDVPIGSGCVADGECVTGLCIPERNDAGSVGWTGGTCSLECSTDCPTGTTCVSLEDGHAYCVPVCASGADCRTGYVCSTDVGACLPDCRLGWDCGSKLVCDEATGACSVPPGNAPIGSVCTYNVECASELCIPEGGDAGSPSWSGGMCSLECSNATCPAGATCVGLADGSAYCLPSCSAAADCRAGYVCSAGVRACLPDCRLGWDCGSSFVCDAATGACTPPPGNEPIGSACTLSLECASGQCIAESNESGAVSWTGGTCSQECTTTACPAGVTCVSFKDGSSYCLPSCASPADCRDGYICSTEVGACLPDCRLGWSCGADLVCDAATGGCVLDTAVVGTTKLGDACTVYYECASGLCIQERTGTSSLAWSAGMCSQECSTIACPTGAICVPMENGSAYCVPACASTADCRADYICDIEVLGCLPDCRLGWSCGTRLVCDAASGSCVPPSSPDAGVPDGGYADSGRTDGGRADAGVSDSGWRGPGDTGGSGPGGSDAGRGGGPGPGGT